MFADVFTKLFARSPIKRGAASSGVTVGANLWDNFHVMDKIIQHTDVAQPENDAVATYRKLTPIYAQTWKYLSGIADLMKQPGPKH